MKRWIIFFLVCLIVGIVLFTLMESDSGYVLINFNGKTIETSFWFAISCVFISTIILYILWACVRGVLLGTIGAAKRSGRWLTDRKERSIEQQLRDGLLYLLTGNWFEANKQLNTVPKDTALPIVRAISSAHCLHKLHQPEQALKVLEEAEKTYEHDTAWILKARLAILIDTHAHHAAEHVLARLKTISPNDKVVSQLEMAMRLGKQQWQKASALLPSLHKKHILSDDEHHEMSVRTWASALKDVEIQEAEQLENIWQSVPKKLKGEPKIFEAYIETLMVVGDDDRCEQALVQSLNKLWQPELLDLYAKIQSKDTNKQINRAQAWQKKIGDSFELNLALGILSARDQLWGQAKQYLERAVKEQATHKACYFLAVVLENMGDHTGSYEYYKRSAEAPLNTL